MVNPENVVVPDAEGRAYPTSEEMMGEMRAFAVDVARNWREAKWESLNAMVEVVKCDTQMDKLGGLLGKLAEMDVF